MAQSYLKPYRLGLIKFLGLWGGSQQIDSNQDDKENLDPITKSKKFTTTEGYLGSTITDLKSAIKKSEEKVISVILEKGIPGLVVCVAKQHQIVWNAAFGYCDVENQLECSPDARMRIASISKSMFASTLVGHLIDNNNLDVKSSIYKYITTDEFPKPKFQDKEFDITIEQLLSHTAGIRSYNDENLEATLRPIGSPKSLNILQNDHQYNQMEFFQRKKFRNSQDAISIIKDSPLVNEPGNYEYTTYGYTLLSAVIERFMQKNMDSKQQIEDYWTRLLKDTWNLHETTLDLDEPILSKRARYYMRSGRGGSLVNAPYTDNSYKWAGGGIVSTTRDLAKFGIALIDSYKSRESAKLRRSTIDLLWKEVSNSYGLGFHYKKLDSFEYKDKFAIYHTGGAAGASSVFILFPESEIVVAIICNLHEISLSQLGFFIAKQFEDLPIHSIDESSNTNINS